MFRKQLASFETHGVRIDTLLEPYPLQPGQSFRARVEVHAGDAPEALPDVLLAVCVSLPGGGVEVLQSFTIKEAFAPEANKRKVIPFGAPLAEQTPVTELECGAEGVQVWMAAGLDLESIKAQCDAERLPVYPTDAADRFLQVVEHLGYRASALELVPGHLEAQGFATQGAFYQRIAFSHAEKPAFNAVFKTGVTETQVAVIQEDSVKLVTVNHGDISLQPLKEAIEQQL